MERVRRKNWISLKNRYLYKFHYIFILYLDKIKSKLFPLYLCIFHLLLEISFITYDIFI